MMRARGLGDLQPHFIARQRAPFRGQQLLHNRQPARVGQRVHHRMQRHVTHGRMVVGFHTSNMPRTACADNEGNFLTSKETKLSSTRIEQRNSIDVQLTNINQLMPTLFDPVHIGAWNLPNRIIMAPLTRQRAGVERIPNALMAEYYSQRASAGMIISEATAVTPMGVGYADTPGIWSKEQVEGWKLVTKAVHNAG